MLLNILQCTGEPHNKHLTPECQWCQGPCAGTEGRWKRHSAALGSFCLSYSLLLIHVGDKPRVLRVLEVGGLVKGH